jgi:uncharacterized protein YuzE
MTYVHYDRDADALYAAIPGRESARVARTVPATEDYDYMIDYDADGQIIGIEILGVSTLPPPPRTEERPCP